MATTRNGMISRWQFQNPAPNSLHAGPNGAHQHRTRMLCDTLFYCFYTCSERDVGMCVPWQLQQQATGAFCVMPFCFGDATQPHVAVEEFRNGCTEDQTREAWGGLQAPTGTHTHTHTHTLRHLNHVTF